MCVLTAVYVAYYHYHYNIHNYSNEFYLYIKDMLTYHLDKATYIYAYWFLTISQSVSVVVMLIETNKLLTACKVSAE